MFTVNEIFCRKDYPSDQTDAVVVDIGSNIGISALYFLTRNDHARCYLFEPDPRNVDRLHRQLENFKGRYELTECAVSNHDGQVAFGRESSGRYGGNGIAWEESITVECRHINRVLAEVVEKERAIDLLKIDTEGIEIATVKAIDPDLQKSVRRIFIEAQPEEDLLPERFLQQQPGPVCQLINLKALS
jgi:FkbM family methyltransferase